MGYHEMSIEDEIADVRDCKPHVVILGAGASVAALPIGDKNGKILPTMDTFIDTLELNDTLSNFNLSSGNFEKIYSELVLDKENNQIKAKVENKIYKYFSSLELPDEPNLYDHLILSLRKKDRIFTFNWDPFLIQAYRRNSNLTNDLPTFTFLHGNVMVGSGIEHFTRGTINNKCKVCGNAFKPSRLLYPITNKDYTSDIFIKYEWEIFDWALNNAAFLTIFGYGAPETDVNAIETMKSSWNRRKSRSMEEIEIIDIKEEDEIYSKWEPFIHSDHYQVTNSFYNSWIANHPRRSIEAYYHQYWEIKYIDNNPIPKNIRFDELWAFYRNLIENEKNVQNLT